MLTVVPSDLVLERLEGITSRDTSFTTVGGQTAATGVVVVVRGGSRGGSCGGSRGRGSGGRGRG